MATLPSTRFARALAVGLALAGTVFVGTTSIQGALASAAPLTVVVVEEPGPSPAPNPAPDAQGPVDPGSPQAAARPHRRHIDGDPVMRH